MSILGALALLSIVAVAYLFKKKAGVANEQADSLVYRQ
jgi:hypothetical protein